MAQQLAAQGRPQLSHGGSPASKRHRQGTDLLTSFFQKVQLTEWRKRNTYKRAENDIRKRNGSNVLASSERRFLLVRTRVANSRKQSSMTERGGGCMLGARIEKSVA